jgi:hypothetical protein
MKTRARKQFVFIVASLMICFIATVLLRPVIVSGEEDSSQGKDQLVDALDASIARVIDSGKWRELMNSDPVAAALVVNIADCYPRITDGEDVIYPFPQNPVGLLKDIIDTKKIIVGDYDVNDPFVPGTFHVFDTVNPLILRAIIDELGAGYGLDPVTDPIEIVKNNLWPPSSALMFARLALGRDEPCDRLADPNPCGHDINGFNAALGATVSVDGVEKRRRDVARFSCTVFGTPWFIHVRDDSSYTTFDDVVADTTADLCVGQLSSRLSGDYFKNAASITKMMDSDDLTGCSEGVLDETYDAYLHFDPVPYSEDLRAIPMGIVSGIPIWVAGDTSTSVVSTTTTTTDTSTTTTSSDISCPIEQIYGGDAKETVLLRYFRDTVLSTTPGGQEIVRLYYAWGPAIVTAMKADGKFKGEVTGMVDGIVSLIGGVE